MYHIFAEYKSTNLMNPFPSLDAFEGIEIWSEVDNYEAARNYIGTRSASKVLVYSE